MPDGDEGVSDGDWDLGRDARFSESVDARARARESLGAPKSVGMD